MALNESMEMYLETIYLLEQSNGHAHVVDISRELEVSKAGVTKASKILREGGYINKEPYGSITLTSKGREIAKGIYKKHRMISSFLRDSLDISFEEADKNACKLEHILSDSVIDAIEAYLEKRGHNE